MHQALLIDEIIRVIFDICGGEGRRTLDRLARCCTAWKDPALDILWSSLPCATPLFRLIPGVLEKDDIFVSWLISLKVFQGPMGDCHF